MWDDKVYLSIHIQVQNLEYEGYNTAMMMNLVIGKESDNTLKNIKEQYEK